MAAMSSAAAIARACTALAGARNECCCKHALQRAAPECRVYDMMIENSIGEIVRKYMGVGVTCL